jgi:glutaconate CoA-transferase subunit A
LGGIEVLSNTVASRYALDLKKKRRKIEEKIKSPESKIMGLDEAIRRFVSEGSHIAVGGCLYSRTPTAAIHEIIRQRIRGLTLSRSLVGMEADLLLGAALLRKVVTSWWSVGYAWGISRAMRLAVEQQLVTFEEWSHLSLGLRYRAAAMGVTFLPTFSMLGADLEKVNDVKSMTCPYSGERMLLVPALYPDVGIIHAQMADEAGNVRIGGYEFMDQDIARASERVIVTVEKVVDSRTFRKRPDMTTIPFLCVDAVVKIPHGSYPSECWGLYEADFDHFAKFAERTNEKGIEGARQYANEYVNQTKSFQMFLNKIGPNRLSKLRKNMRNVLK